MSGKSILLMLALLAFTTLTSCIHQPAPSPTATPSPITITVYFTDQDQYATGIPPFEVPVTREVSPPSSLPEAVLLAFFEGPTSEERQQGLVAITSGFDGLASLVIEDGIARVYLTGRCASQGATYTIAQPLMRNLLQFPEISYVKIYDEYGETEEPEGLNNSIPFCLEP